MIKQAGRLWALAMARTREGCCTPPASVAGTPCKSSAAGAERQAPLLRPKSVVVSPHLDAVVVILGLSSFGLPLSASLTVEEEDTGHEESGTFSTPTVNQPRKHKLANI